MPQVAFTTLVSGLTREEKGRFYLALARNITVAVRTIWSDDDLPVTERLERLKWMNEAMHRVINDLSEKLVLITVENLSNPLDLARWRQRMDAILFGQARKI